METLLRLMPCLLVAVSSGLVVASAFADNDTTVGVAALLLGNFACFIAGLVLSDD